MTLGAPAFALLVGAGVALGVAVVALAPGAALDGASLAGGGGLAEQEAQPRASMEASARSGWARRAARWR
jgi:hypothetical protein